MKVLAREPPDAAAQCETCDAGLRHDPGRHGLTCGEVAESTSPRRQPPSTCTSCLSASTSTFLIREVERDAARAQRFPADPVSTPAHREQRAVLPSCVDDRDHIFGLRAAHDQRRTFVDHGVPGRPRFVVPIVFGGDEFPGKRSRQLGAHRVRVRALPRVPAAVGHTLQRLVRGTYRLSLSLRHSSDP